MKKNFLAICAIFKNEAPYLKEWIEYHRLVGVDHFYLYNNESSDRGIDVLAPYVRNGRVTLIPWPDREKERKEWGWVKNTQVTAYEHAFTLFQGQVEWMAVIDIDEFILPVSIDSIVPILQQHKMHPGIEVFWQVFGTSGYAELPSNALMIDLLNKKALPICALNRQCKTILKPEYYKNFFWPPHRCEYIGDGQAFGLGKDELILNHYMNRSAKDFHQKLKMRESNGKFSEAEKQILMNLGNDEEDDESGIRRFSDQIRSVIQV